MIYIFFWLQKRKPLHLMWLIHYHERDLSENKNIYILEEILYLWLKETMLVGAYKAKTLMFASGPGLWSLNIPQNYIASMMCFTIPIFVWLLFIFLFQNKLNLKRSLTSMLRKTLQRPVIILGWKYIIRNTLYKMPSSFDIVALYLGF